MRELVIAGRRIADDTPAYVVAEIGGNHGGSRETATRLIQMAASHGVDAVKFQKRENESLYVRACLEAPYQNENSFGATYGAHRAALELSPRSLTALGSAGQAAGVCVFATPFDERSADHCDELGFPAFKLHSGALTDAPLIRHVAAFGKPVILSTGGGTLEDIHRAVLLLEDVPHALLHCTASYPLTPAEANLQVIRTLRGQYPNTVIGWSSHATGPALSLVAYALGARIIEHHVTLDRASKGTDHAFSLEPGGLRWLMEELRKAHVAMGDGIKRFYPSEVAPIAKMRRVQTPEGWRITG